MIRLDSLSLAALLSLGAAGVLTAQQGPKPKVTEAAARATALAQVPGGTVQSQKLETEHGRLVYAFDVKTAKAGTEQVEVDANSGKIVPQEAQAMHASKKHGMHHARKASAHKKSDAGKKTAA
ncbi:MAG TPA: PepSY domain-containing protein [Longimicrobiaceae bacterium]|nr:PepSY domain-containing protein [Longimicrobiaceae bacterium]